MVSLAVPGRSNRDRARGAATPLAYFGVVVVIAVLLLPSALRPPPDEATTSAEFSPDAPPEDEAPEAILSSLRQAGSAGAGTDPAALGPEATGTPLAPPTTIERRAPRGQCFGDPPRQTDSLYSAGCVPGWVGDNGGATTKGVTGEEFVVAWMINDSDAAIEGRVTDEAPEGETATHRHARIYQTYFNQRYEFHGRRMQIVLVKHPLAGEQEGRAAIQRADDQFHAFATVGISTNAGAIEEALRRKLVTWLESENPHDYYAKHHPYLYSFNMHADKIVAFASEMICKQLAGKPPSFNDQRDLTFDYGKPRVFGLVLYEDQTRYGSEDIFNRELAKCGARLKLTVKHNLYDNQSGSGGAITKLRAEGVTTVIVGGDPITPVLFTNEAANSEYWPEWINVGTAGLHDNGAGQLFQQEEWAHSIGIFYPEIPRAATERDYYRAYKSVDPGATPGAAGLFRQLQMVANGVQGAGPKITPETFWKGLQKMPKRPPDPVWSIGGAFDPNDFTYADFMSLSWWDPEAQDPEEDLPGANRWLWGGKRFALGEIPTEPAPFFSDGVITGGEAEAYWAERQGGTGG